MTPARATFLSLALSIILAILYLSQVIDQKTFMRLLPIWLVIVVILGGIAAKHGKK